MNPLPNAESVPPVIERIAEVLNVHRWKSMGVSSVECECGQICYGDESLTQFPADEAFRRHVAAEISRVTEYRGAGDFWSQAEWAEWSNDLATLIPEDDVAVYSNPEGAQEGIIEDCFRAYVTERQTTVTSPGDKP